MSLKKMNYFNKMNPAIMKTKMMFFLLLMFVFVLCQKKEYDFRKKYTGKYSFIIRVVDYGCNTNGVSEYQTNGEVQLSENKDKIKIIYYNFINQSNYVQEYIIREDGALLKDTVSSKLYHYTSSMGEFPDKKSLHLQYTIYCYSFNYSIYFINGNKK